MHAMPAKFAEQVTKIHGGRALCREGNCTIQFLCSLHHRIRYVYMQMLNTQCNTMLTNYLRRSSAQRYVKGVSTKPLYNLGKMRSVEFNGIWSPLYEEHDLKRMVHAPFREEADAFCQKNPTDLNRVKPIQASLKAANINSEDIHHILEIGAGHGNSIASLRTVFPKAHIIATDFSPEMLRLLSKAWARDPRVYAVQADGEELAFKNGSMDFIWGWGVLHHLFKPDAALRRCKEILRPGGIAFFEEPIREGHEAHGQLYKKILGDSRSSHLTPKLQRHFQGYILQLRYWRLKEKVLPIFSCMDDKWIFDPEYFVTTCKALCFQTCEILSMYGLGFAQKIEMDLHALDLSRDVMPTWAWDIVKTADSDTKPKPPVSASFLLKNTSR
jgi:SAM-dependent methyltransferase